MYKKSELALKLLSTENELDRFDMLTDAAFAAEKFPERLKTDENRLVSCETKTWYRLEFDGKIKLLAESDSVFVKGLCAVLADIAAKIGKEDLPAKIGFADECFSKGIIDIKRRNGLNYLEEKIIAFAIKNIGGTK